MQGELRIYTIMANHLDEFVDEWRRLVYPLRVRHGFEVTGPWLVRKASEFVWIIEAPNEKSFAQRRRDYELSPERAAMDPDPGRHVIAAEVRALTSV